MFFSYIKAVCKLLDIKNVSLPDSVWGSGGDLQSACYSPDDADTLYAAPIVYWGNREAVRTLSQASLSRSYMFMMLRDPRDCLVSMFYSFFGGHAAPGYLSGEGKESWLKEMKKRREYADIDAYVLERAPGYYENIREMLSFAKRTKRHRIIRYEDYIHDKIGLCSQIHDALSELEHTRLGLGVISLPRMLRCSFPGLRTAAIKRIASKHDVMPTTERPGQHVRRALPGDHRTKLRPATIGRLNDVFGSTLAEYSYDVQAPIDR